MIGKSDFTENFQQPKVSLQNSENLVAVLLVKVLESVNKQNQTPNSSSDLNSVSPQEIASADINGKRLTNYMKTVKLSIKKAFIVQINKSLISVK